MANERKNPIGEKSYAFALEIVKAVRNLQQQQKEFVLTKQLLRAGTSIGANVVEASAAQSRPDFISKMSIASKEARETLYWLNLLRDSGVMEEKDAEHRIRQADELVRLLTSIVKTASATSGNQFKTQN